MRRASCFITCSDAFLQLFIRRNMSFLQSFISCCLIVLRLGIEEVGVEAILLHEVLVRALFRYPAAGKNDDAVAEAAGGHPVGNIDGGLVPDQLPEVLVDFCLGKRVESRRGFV